MSSSASAVFAADGKTDEAATPEKAAVNADAKVDADGDTAEAKADGAVDAKAKAKADAKTKAKADAKTKAKADAKANANADAKVSGSADVKADAKPRSTGTKVAKGGGGGAGGIASHVASFVAGSFVGIPVQIWRKSRQETIQATRDLVGDTDKKWLTGAAAVLGVPAGILSGTIQGFVYGPLDAYRGTKDEPFSPEAFSLGDSK